MLPPPFVLFGPSKAHPSQGEEIRKLAITPANINYHFGQENGVNSAMVPIIRMCLITLVGLSASLTWAQQSKAQITAAGVTITEPGVYQLATLFQRADTVASVKVVSGDTENYSEAVCKAEVLKGFKGASAGESIYFGPCVGERLGWEYIVFLLDTPDGITPKAASSTSYGRVRYAKVFDEGYSKMETSYACVFDGKEIAQKCDYGVRVCTDYIKLPKSIPAFPPESNDPPFGCRWVRKNVFLSLLDTLGNSKK